MRVDLVGSTTLINSYLNDNAHLYRMTRGKFKKLEGDLLMMVVESMRRGEMELDLEIMDSIIIFIN